MNYKATAFEGNEPKKGVLHVVFPRNCPYFLGKHLRMLPCLTYVNADTVYVVLREAAQKKGNSDVQYFFYSLLFLAAGAIIIFNRKKIRQYLANIRVSDYEFNLLGFKLSGKISYSNADQDLAWNIYVELITRVSGNALPDGAGLLRESLTSLYAAFTALRDILKGYGKESPRIPQEEGRYSVVSLLLLVMNQQIRPFISKWHPLLQEYEQQKPATMSQFEYEQQWRYNMEFREELKKLQAGLADYIEILRGVSAQK